MADKIDFKRTLDSYRARPDEFRVIDVPDMSYLMIDGHGDPNTSPAYRAALEALYPVAYQLKFASRRDLGRDYVVPPLEGLWWADDMSVFTTARDKSRWSWTMLLMVPGWTDQDMVAAAVAQAGAKNPPARLGDLRLQPLSEGRCVQTLHVGSFDDEAAVLERMHHEFIPDHGLRMVGRHHEIYLSTCWESPWPAARRPSTRLDFVVVSRRDSVPPPSSALPGTHWMRRSRRPSLSQHVLSDVRRVAPEKLRTILRQPVAATPS